MTNATLTAVPGVEVGHWTDPTGTTGCTVAVLPEPNVVAVDVRGSAPGSRETDLLRPGMRVQSAQAILLTGGSAFGLAAADGVMAALEAVGRGHPTPMGPVPIVPSAVIYDLRPGASRPDAAAGRGAFEAASAEPVRSGRVGVGAGATVAKWRGFEHARPGGVGSHAVPVGGGVVAALVVVNAVGDAFTLEGMPLTGGPAVPSTDGFGIPGANTTLGIVATDARLDRQELSRLLVRAHDAYGACLRPAHTGYDGDAVFAVSCGTRQVAVESLAEATFEAIGRAIQDAVESAGR